MNVLVVDASVAAGWFANEEYSEAATSILSNKNDLHVPDFFYLEMDNVVCKWAQRGIVTLPEGEEIRAAVRAVPMRSHPFGDLLDTAWRMANRTRRSVYDCAYVALAAALGGRMITADRRLYDALARGPLRKSVMWVGDAVG